MLRTVAISGGEALPADRELLTRFVESRDEESFRALVARFGPLVWHVCLRLTRQRQDAEDAFQATLLTLVEQVGRIRRAESVGSWLYGVAFRTSLRVRRRSQRRRECALDHDVRTRDEFRVAAEDGHKWEALHDELHGLPRKYRDPLVMRYLLDQPVAQTCSALGLSPTQLKGRLQRARRELRARLALRGVVSLSLAAVVVEAARAASQAREMTDELVARACQGINLSAGAVARSEGLRAGLAKAAGKELNSMIIMLETVSVVGCAVALAFGFPARFSEPAAPNVGISAVAAGEKNAPPKMAEFDSEVAEAPAARVMPVAASANERTVLSYGDGTPEGKKSMAGTGEMIHFTAPQDKGVLTVVELHGARYGHPQAPKEDFKIYVLADDRARVLHTELVPYGRFERGEAKWVELKLQKPVDVPRSFWIVVDFNAEATKGIYVSYDTSTGGEHSMVGLPGKEAAKTAFGGDWMIRAVVGK